MARDAYESADRNHRDDAGVGPYAEKGMSLASLKELGNWDIAEGEPDIRGWQVRTISGRVIGKVADLLIDTEQREVVMLDIDVEGRHGQTLAPIRAAQLDRHERVVLIDSEDLHERALPDAERTAERKRAAEREVEVTHDTERLADRTERDRRTVRFPRGEGEQVIEQRPVVVEEVVVRRRTVGEGEAVEEADRHTAAQDEHVRRVEEAKREDEPRS